MRLLDTKESDTDNIKVKEFSDDEVPPYVILSHTWDRKGEVTLQDMNRTDAKNKNGYEKVKQCCLIAKVNGFQYVWIDTCCIDKTSSAELSEAINSMYRWYQEAEICYTYLADVQSKIEISKSTWFTRGWTLQELIAPSDMIFFNEKWKELGNKTDLQHDVSDYTGIPVSILSGEDDLETFSIAQRMSWAAKRKTSRIEDRAYCLMGIFGVNMPLIYGERETAFIRLQEEIMRISDDHSLFAWTSPDNRGGLLATSPAAFISSHNIVQFNPFDTPDNPLTVSSRGIHLDLHVIGIGRRGLGLAVLHCKERGSGDKPVAIYVRDLFLTMQRFRRVKSEEFKQLDLKQFRPSQYPVRRICVQAGRLTRMGKLNSEKWDSIPPDEIYPDNVLTKLMDFNELTALPRAAAKGYEDVVWLLLTRSDVEADLKTVQSGQSPLLLAARYGHEAIIKLLLDRGAAIEAVDEFDQTSLLQAAEKGYEAIVKLLLDRGAATEAKDKSGQTPLLLAVKYKREAIVKLLLDRGAAIEAKNTKTGQTSLILATEKGDEAIIKLLLDKGAATEAKNKFGQTSLLQAAGYGHEAIVKVLLDKGAATEAKDDSDQTPLLWAAKKGYEAIVKLLLDRGAAIEAKNSKTGQTSLILATEKGDEAIIKLLLDRGAAIEAMDEIGQTSLLQAADKGYEAIVKLLLDRGAAIEANYGSGKTPLLSAVVYEHEAIVKLLLDRGAATEAKDGSDQTPLIWAAKKGHEAIVKLLLGRGAAIEAKDGSGKTPLLSAVVYEHEAIVKLLLDRGAAIEAKYRSGKTPLLSAVIYEHEAVVKLLLDRGAATEAKDGSDQTPLVWAAKKGHEAIVKLLLGRGAAIEAKDNSGQTPLSWAAIKGNEAIVKLLLERGARHGQMQLSQAAKNGRETVVKLLRFKP